jgi:hypothetical protein
MRGNGTPQYRFRGFALPAPRFEIREIHQRTKVRRIARQSIAIGSLGARHIATRGEQGSDIHMRLWPFGCDTLARE